MVLPGATADAGTAPPPNCGHWGQAARRARHCGAAATVSPFTSGDSIARLPTCAAPVVDAQAWPPLEALEAEAAVAGGAAQQVVLVRAAPHAARHALDACRRKAGGAGRVISKAHERRGQGTANHGWMCRLRTQAGRKMAGMWLPGIDAGYPHPGTAGRPPHSTGLPRAAGGPRTLPP